MIWQGQGLDEVAIERVSGKQVIRIDPSFYRPCEVDQLIGNPARAERDLGWSRQYDLDGLVEDMVSSEIAFVNQYSS